ncbi:Uncharacterised protein g6861 [Pycnogonum litorale]
MRGVKTKRSGRESYGDHAVGYVQVRKTKSGCTVRAKITPEHKLRSKAYDVHIELDEESQKIVSVDCESCVASLGGCKHGVALILWLHRRSEEPAPTQVACYWKTSKLSKVGSTIKFIKLAGIKSKGQQPPQNDNYEQFLSDVLSNSKCSVLAECLNESNLSFSLIIDNMISDFLMATNDTFADFLFCQKLKLIQI